MMRVRGCSLADGGAVQVQSEVTVIDARLLTPEQREAFKLALLAARAHGELEQSDQSA